MVVSNSTRKSKLKYDDIRVLILLGSKSLEQLANHEHKLV